MLQNTTPEPSEDWLGLTRLAGFLNHRQDSAGSPVASGTDDEVVDRLYRMLEILALVEENRSSLQDHARAASDHEAMELAVDLRRLANRLQAVGDFLTTAGGRLIELEDQILVELDERSRGQSGRIYAA